jgi:endo-1,4-beta-xylanase
MTLEACSLTAFTLACGACVSLAGAAAASLERQAAIYRKVMRTCLQEPACRAIRMWGFTDAHSWIPKFMPGFGAALPLDAAYQPKAAWSAIREELAGSSRP